MKRTQWLVVAGALAAVVLLGVAVGTATPTGPAVVKTPVHVGTLRGFEQTDGMRRMLEQHHVMSRVGQQEAHPEPRHACTNHDRAHVTVLL